MAALSWDRIIEKGKQHNKTVICEVEKRGGSRYFKVKCNVCESESTKRHMQFDQCRKCAIDKRTSNNEAFIKESNIVHQGKYDYNLVEYVNAYTKVKIICKKCNSIFFQAPSHHIRGNGCRICQFNNQKYNTEEFILKAEIKHLGKFDYSLVEYVRCDTKVKIKCKTCNDIFEQTPVHHLAGYGCKNCYIENHYSNTTDFIQKSNIIHQGKYDYRLVEYVKCSMQVKIICKKCNNIFLQIPSGHLRGYGCPKCNESKGENRVAKYLTDNNISFISQKTFKTLRDKRPLKPDFYLDDLNLLIEYDGEFHYKPLIGSTPEIKQKNLEDCQHRDKIKNEWAKANNIPLLRIPYWDFDRIEELIDEFILQHTRKKETKQLVLEM